VFQLCDRGIDGDQTTWGEASSPAPAFVFFSEIAVFFLELPAMGVQKYYKNRFAKTIVSKKIDKKIATAFSRFLLSRFWAFLGEGV
jgi:hypothetical protein